MLPIDIDGTLSVMSEEELHDIAVEKEPMMKFFSYFHLPPHLQRVSKMFWSLAVSTIYSVPLCDERTVSLRKLLESKDAAVRAVVYEV